MKNLRKIFIALVGVLTMASCGEEIDTVAEVQDTAGLLVSISQSSGAFLGSPQAGMEISEAPVSISEANLDYVITLTSGDMSNIEKLEIVKFFNGDLETSGEAAASTVAETTTLPFTATISSVDEFLAGSGLSESDLRIGDSFTFRLKVHQKDGDVYFYNGSMGRLTLALNCSYDLTGSYTMTNTVCASSVTVAISQNPDGSWYAETADGGLLQFCSTNSTLQNEGSFNVGCGGIVTSFADGDPTFCGGYGIGCIEGGSWDQDSGILILENSNAFFSWAGATYTSTYTRM